MKINIFKNITIVLLISFAGTVLANQVTIINVSKNLHSLVVEYKIAHKNRGQATVYSTARSTAVIDKTVINFNLDGFELAGIVPISVDGHALPASVTEFDKPQRCSLTTDKNHRSGSLSLTLTGTEIMCSQQRGIFG